MTAGNLERGDERLAGSDAVAQARRAQVGWARLDVRRRLAVIRRLRQRLASEPDVLTDAIGAHRGRTAADSLAAEIIPLADACRFLERRAQALLAPRRMGAAGRPLWLAQTVAEIRREPLGTVLIVAPGNYRLFLAGVQLVQALVAGNAAVIKPAPGGSKPIVALRAMLTEAGLPSGVLQILPESVQAAGAAIEDGIDKVVLTGSADTGRTVLAALAPRLIPATLELSGRDPVHVLPGADLGLTARALVFGVSLNGGATCIAPRRVFVSRDQAPDLEARLRPLIANARPAPVPAAQMRRVQDVLGEARSRGSRLIGALPARDAATMVPTIIAEAPIDLAQRDDGIFAPLLFLIEVDDPEQALRLSAECPYALGASVFGPESDARAIAARLDAGSVTINDLIVPTADPRLPFGGRQESGYGVTRGAEGLLEFTAIKSLSVRRGRSRPHYASSRPSDRAFFAAYLRAVHGRPWPLRARAVIDLVRALATRMSKRQ